MKQTLLAAFLALLFSQFANAQVAISTNGSAPHNSAMLDVRSDNKGVLITRLSSAQRKGIASPAVGLLVFDIDEGTLYFYDGSRWLGFLPYTDDTRPASNFSFPPDLQDTLYAGYAVSIWDQFAVVGAPGRTSGGINLAGGTYVYRKVGNNWQFFTTLVPTSGAVDTAYFGYSVNVCGNSLIVGAPMHKNGSNQRTGAAYIYNFNGTNWVNTQVIFGSTANTSFGSVVDINQYGTYAAVSEPGATAGGFSSAGLVRVYNKVASFTLQASLQDPSPAGSAMFGYTMAMSPSGDYVLVGAPNKTVAANSGNGYIGLFRRSGSAWSQFQTYTPISESGQGIGSSVDVTDAYAMYAVKGKKTAKYNNIPPSGLWSGFEYPAFPEAVNGVAIDPVTQDPFVFYGNTVASINGFVIKKINSGVIQPLPQLFSLYGNDYIIGLFTEPSIAGALNGAFYIGKK